MMTGRAADSAMGRAGARRRSLSLDFRPWPLTSAEWRPGQTRGKRLASCATSVAWEPAQSFCVLQKRGGGSWECVTSLFDFPALKLFVRRKPVTLAQCDYYRNELGSFPHLYWRMRFCSLACMSAYQQRLSPQTRQKIVILEPNNFFENQIKQCRSQAQSAANKSDRAFWLQLAHRWERLSQPAPRATSKLPKANAALAPR